MKNLKNWMIIILIASILALMLMITKNYNEDFEFQQKIYNHSEIKDTI
jgi:hypothetical protein